jgi:DNA-binding helix-hairpin-helix protein with protein kinase domain
MTDLLLERARTKIRLGRELGHGGEGSVFEIETCPDRVAKIYKTAPAPRKVEKLAVMAEKCDPSLLGISAWPLDLLREPGGTARGFIMPRVVARRGLHELYSPKSRSVVFPAADFRFLVHVACNVARAFAVVHDAGVVIGDVNHGNLLVAADGTVTLIDCDSFQVTHRGRILTCDVGSPLFTAPELNGQAFHGLQRNPSHDLFGLAILLFHLLYMGRHPFAGRYRGHGEMPIERAIAEYRFAYASGGASNGMERPPGTISLETLGNNIAQYFLSAFERVGNGRVRPSARIWLSELDQMQHSLRKCQKISSHYYPSHLATCPWCTIEERTSVRLFGYRIQLPPDVGAVDIATLWKAIVAIPDPGPPPLLPSQRPGTLSINLPASKRTDKLSRQALTFGLGIAGMAVLGLGYYLGIIAILGSIILFGLAYSAWPRVSEKEIAEANRLLDRARGEWSITIARWEHEALGASFMAKRRKLESVYFQLNDLPNERRRRLAKLNSEREKRQREAYLERFRIDTASISGIGTSRAAMLAAFGIETAADLDAARINQIPGFGEILTSRLITWRATHEGNFRYNPNQPLSPQELQTLEQELELTRRGLVRELREGPAVLQQISHETKRARERLSPTVEKAWTALKQAEVQRNSL